MPVAVLIEIPDGTQEQYERLFETVRGMPVDDAHDADHAGGLIHMAGSTDNGWCIIDVWESGEAARRFLQDKVAPAANELGLPPSGPPTIVNLRALHIHTD
jgi:hypothetical protein